MVSLETRADEYFVIVVNMCALVQKNTEGKK